jgi:hypothetical protein
MLLLIQDPDTYLKNIVDAKAIIHVLDFFEKQKHLREKERWKTILLEKLETINNDEYYNYNLFSKVGQKEDIYREASGYFIEENESFIKFLDITMAIQEKIKPENNKQLRADGNSETNLPYTQPNKNNDILNSYFMELGLLVDNFSIEKRDNFINDFNIKTENYLNNSELNNIDQFPELVNQLSKEILKHETKSVLVLFLTIIDNLHVHFLNEVRAQHYEKESLLEQLIYLFRGHKLSYDIFINRDFEELIPELNKESFDILLKQDFNKGIAILKYLVNLDVKHPLLSEAGKFYGELKNLEPFIDQQKNLNFLISIFFKLEIYSREKKIVIIAFQNFHKGRLDITLKYLEISSTDSRRELIDFIWPKLVNEENYDFLIKTISIWIKNEENVKHFIKICLENKLSNYLDVIFELCKKEFYFDIIIEIYFDQKNDFAINQLRARYAAYLDIINPIFDNKLETYLNSEVMSSLESGSAIRIFQLMTAYINKRSYIENLVENYFGKEPNLKKIMSEDDIIILISFFHSNYNILKYLIFEKAKRLLTLNEATDLAAPIYSILDLEVWEAVIKKKFG